MPINPGKELLSFGADGSATAAAVLCPTPLLRKRQRKQSNILSRGTVALARRMAPL